MEALKPIAGRNSTCGNSEGLSASSAPRPSTGMHVLPIAKKLEICFTARIPIPAPCRMRSPRPWSRVLKSVAKGIDPGRGREPCSHRQGPGPGGPETQQALGPHRTGGGPNRGQAAGPGSVVATAWRRVLASAALPTDGSDPGSWKGKPCATQPRCGPWKPFWKRPWIHSLQPKGAARRVRFAHDLAVKLTQENETSPIGDGPSARKEPCGQPRGRRGGQRQRPRRSASISSPVGAYRGRGCH